MATTPEGRVKNVVKRMLDKYGVYHFSPATGGYGSSGIPDIICCYFGKFIGIECKAGKNKPTALQELSIAKIRLNRGYAFVINETNYAELEEVLQEIKAAHADLPPDNLTSSLDKKGEGETF